MPEEKDPSTAGQSDDPNADPGQETQLPEDPEGLKAALIESNRKAAQLQRQSERLAEENKEKDLKADYWQREADRRQKERERELAAKPPENKKPKEEDVDPLFEQDPFEMLSKEGGVEKFFDAGRKKFGLLTREEAERIADDKVEKKIRETREKDLQENGQYAHVAKTYPALRDTTSALSVETAAEFERVKEQFPEMSNAVATELAAGRAAAKLNYTAPKATTPKDSEETDADRERRITAAGGDPGKNKARRPAVVTDEIRRLARKTAGGELSEEALKRVAARTQAGQSSHR